MGRAPCCSKVGLHKGPWTAREDTLLTKYIKVHGEGDWRSLPRKAGLLRCGKSCRLRWMNYLRPDIKRGNIGADEEDLIIRLHSLIGNRWSLIAGRLPGRTDNEIKNYWNTHLSKKLKSQEENPNTNSKEAQGSPLRRRLRNNNNNKEIREAPTQTKVHLPKPTRLSSFKSSKLFEREEMELSVSGDKRSAGPGEKEEEGFRSDGSMDPPWEDELTKCDGGIFLADDQDDQQQDLFLFPDFHTQTHAPIRDALMLERLYGEYQELLKVEEEPVQLDAFAESLWIE